MEQETLIRQEQWLRANGLPFVVPLRRRLRGLLPRTSAVLITFALLGIALLIADAAVSGDQTIPLEELIQHPKVVWALLIGLVIALLAIPAGILYGRWQRSIRIRWRLILGAIVILLWLPGLSIAAGILRVNFGLHVPLIERIGLLFLAAAMAISELDHMVTWAARRSFRELASAIPAVARILPLLLLTVLLAFFTGELWQISAEISKLRMWLLGLFLVGLIILIVLPATIDMLDDEDTDDEPAGVLDETPFVEVEPTRTKLTIGERFNLLIVSLSVQSVQIAAFVVLTFFVFATFGAIALTPNLIEKWSGGPAEQLVWLSIKLPMDWSMFRVCLILSLFSGVSFAASTLMDEKYRNLFLGRVADEVRRNIAARHRYRTSLIALGKAPARWQTLVSLDG